MKPPRFNPRWRCQLADRSDYQDIASTGTLQTVGERAALILPGANYATLFAYLWRRFGPPSEGSDEYKELVCYYLTTPVTGVAFRVSPSLSGVYLSFGYALSRRWSKRIQDWDDRPQDDWLRRAAPYFNADWRLGHHRWTLKQINGLARGCVKFNEFAEDSDPATRRAALRIHREVTQRIGPCPPRRRIHYRREGPGGYRWDDPPTPLEEMPASPARSALAAIEHGLRDLLRPVGIRDCHLNACGKVTDEQLRHLPTPVKRSPLAGYGCSPDLILQSGNDDDWWDLAALIRKRGVKETLELLKQVKP